MFFFSFLTRPVQFMAEASFKEAEEKQEMDGLFRNIIGIFAYSHEAQAATVMKSRQLLKPLVQKLGLQAKVAHRGKVRNLVRKGIDTLRAEWGKEVADIDDFVFSDVIYEGEKSRSVQLRFLRHGRFEVREKGKVLLISKLHQKVQIPGVEFTIDSVPSFVRRKKIYHLSFSPWVGIAGSLRKGIEIKPDKMNKSILQLKYSHRNRFLAAKVLNGLMNEYQLYLKSEQDKLAGAQLAYLEKRQEDFHRNLEKGLDEHVAYIKKNLGDKGFIGLDHEMYALLEPHQEYVGKLYNLDLEGMHLDDTKSELPYVGDGPLSIQMDQMVRDIEGLKGERDSITLALHFGKEKRDYTPMHLVQTLRNRLEKVDAEVKKTECHFVDSSLQQEKDELIQKLKKSDIDPFENMQERAVELKKIRASIQDAEHLLQAEEMPEKMALQHDPGNLIHNWIGMIQTKLENKEDIHDVKSDLTCYLKNYTRLLSMREKMLQERIYPLHPKPVELEGIDLPTAREMYKEYNGKLDELQIQIRHLSFAKEQLQDPRFEISSLTGVLNDPISNELLHRCSLFAFQQNDQDNWGAKDQKRLEGELNLHRKFLTEHIQEMIHVKNLSLALLQEKITSLQEVTLDLINQRISVIHQQAKDFVQTRKQNLEKEKVVLQQKIDDLKLDMASIPEKWRLENQLKLKTEMGLKMMQAMTQLVESKTVGFNLQQVQSKPLDLALVPTVAQSPSLFLRSFLAFAVGLIGIFSVRLLRAFFYGFPLSHETLLAYKLHVSGKISFLCDGKDIDPMPDEDLQTLRRIVSFAQVKLISLIAGDGPNYSFSLAELFAKRGNTVLVMNCAFHSKFSPSEVPGLYQFLKKEVKKCPIRKEKHFDYLPFGGATRFGVEILGSAEFLDLLQDFKKSYDVVIIYSKAKPDFEEGKVLVDLSDKAIVTVVNETMEVLQSYTANEKLSYLTL